MPARHPIAFTDIFMIKGALIIGLIGLQIWVSAQDYSAELKSYETSTSLVKRTLTRDVSVQIQINNRSGEKYATVSIPYSKLSKVGHIEAFIKDNRNQVVRKLKKSDISERSNISDMSLYEDDFVKEFTLKHNTYPYTIVYSYQEQQNEFIYVDYWVPVLSSKIPTHKASLSVSLPIDYNISYVSNLVDEFNVDTTGSMVNYTWVTDYRNIVKSEMSAPPLKEFLPSVRIVPLEYQYELNGSFKTWTDYGNWHSLLLKGIQELPAAEKTKINARVKGIEDDKEKIRVLYHYLQDHTRYINITIETGGLKPYPASYVASNKYGDCKALTNYFQSVLSEIGIQSFYSKVYAGEPIQEIDKQFPSQQFNHIILFIPLQTDTIWLDCTSDAAFGYLGTFTQNRDAFVIAENNSKFIRTPSLSAEDVIEVRKIVIPYDRYSQVSVEFQNSYRGDMYELLLDLEENYNSSDKSRILRNYFMEEGFELTDYNIIKSHRDSALIQMTYTASTDQIYSHYGNEILVKNIPFSMPDFEDPEERKLPVQIDYPIHMIDTIIYEIPKGYGLLDSLSNQTVSNGTGSYTLEFTELDNSIQVVKRLLVHPGLYPKSKYQELYTFFNKINIIENKRYIALTK